MSGAMLKVQSTLAVVADIETDGGSAKIKLIAEYLLD